MSASDYLVIDDPAELVRRLNLPARCVDGIARAAAEYRLAFPAALLDRVVLGDERDPVLLQFLPRVEELASVSGFTADPLCERTNGGGPQSEEFGGVVLRKYAGRALILTGGVCAANCRFCFRRHAMRGSGLFPAGETAAESGRRLSERLGLLEGDRSIRELILSGSDPLGLSPDRFELLWNYIKNLSFVNRVRIHTRRPVLAPKTVSNRFFELFSSSGGRRPTVILVFHVNHSSEIGAESEALFRRFSAAGFPLLAQTVLLRGVNDSVEALCALYERLGDCGVIPYYLHQLDRVAGAAHFEVDPRRGREIMRGLRERLSGYLVPRYVREVAGEPFKCPMD